jgi:hypothetical protein
MQNREKEIAFVELASDALKLPLQKRMFFMELVDEFASEFSGKIWEKIISKKAGIKFVDEAGRDFSDGSEAKTGSTYTKYTTKNGKKYPSTKGAITNLHGKTGYIRVAIYNHVKKSIDYFLLPPGHKVKCYFTASNGNQGSGQFSYNISEDTYSNNLELYRVKNLKEVCRKFRA